MMKSAPLKSSSISAKPVGIMSWPIIAGVVGFFHPVSDSDIAATLKRSREQGEQEKELLSRGAEAIRRSEETMGQPRS